jgi:hypothetical protein
MHRQEQPVPSWAFCKLAPEEELEGQNNKAENKNKNADAVDTVHVFDKPCFRPVRIGFPDVEIFRYLPEYAHKKNCIIKIQFSYTEVFCLWCRTAANLVLFF